MNEQQKFLEGLEDDQNPKVDILEQPLMPEGGQPEGTEGKQDDEGAGEGQDNGEDGGLKPRNRRERRLMEKLQAERESSMFLAGKLEARSEAAKAVEEADYLKGIERIYGTDSPESQLATDLLRKAIVGARDDAENRAYARLREEREAEIRARQEADRQLDGVIDEIEDTYGVTLTDAQEKGYFQLLQKMSPKDKNGEIVGLADPHAVWEVFQDKLRARGTDNRAKNLSARSMVNSGASKDSNLMTDAHERFLKENGII